MFKKIQATYRHLCGVKILIHYHQSILKALNQKWSGGTDTLLESVSYLSLAAFTTDFKGVWSRVCPETTSFLSAGPGC